MEWNISTVSNCAYISNIWTDIFAFIYGIIIIFYGFKYKNNILIFLGTGIIIEHILQFVIHKYPIKYRHNNNFKQKINHYQSIDTLVRQSSRYAMAAEQDLSPLIAMLHANYAAGYLWAMKDIYNENQINLVIGKDNLKMLEKYVKKVQDVATKRMTKACPKFVGELSNINIARLAGNI